MALTRFLIRRILSGILVLWIVSLSAFLLFFLRPIDTVARELGGTTATGAQLAVITKTLGLSQPIYVQYWQFVYKLLRHGNFGFSYVDGESVRSILGQDLPRTASLVVGGALLWLIVGLSVGILSAIRARSFFDRFATFGVLTGISMPTFVLGQLLLLAIFLPLNEHGFTWITDTYQGLSTGVVPWLGYFILPWITLATVQAAIYTRLSRGSLIDTLGEDYIRTARAKGLTERRVIYRHGLRAALTPVVSQLGIDVGGFLGGVVVTESVFNVGGIGQDSVQAIATGNLPVILGFVLIAALFVVVANIVVDMVYAVLDPRVRIS